MGDRGAAVGTPEHLGGVAYDKLGVTGYGVAESTDAAAQHLGLPLSGARVAIQGFGAVGSASARRFTELGATVVAVSTAHGALHAPTGLDVDALLTAREEHGDHFVTRAGQGTALPSGAELAVDCEVLVPVALQDVIDDTTAHEIKAKLVVEGANLPTSAAAFAMDARYSGFRPDTTAVFETISTRLRANTTTVLEEAECQDTTPPHTPPAGPRPSTGSVRRCGPRDVCPATDH